VLGFGGRLPAGMAALANGAMAHCLDFDDRTSWGAHSGSSLMPAAFAVAERKGGISGKHMIAAIAAGQDLFIRLRCNVGWDQNWNLSTVIGVFSATATTSYVLGLGREQIANALGIASMQSSGTMQVIYGGSHLRGMYAGFSANTAVVAALLAEKGLTGIDDVFEGKAGIFNVYFDGKYDRAKMLADLGRDYLGAGMLYKPWPVVGIAHTYIHATIEVMKEHRLNPTDIEQIRVFVGASQHQMCTPTERRRTPETAVDAKFSLPFCVALAAAHGEIRIKDFTPTALKDQRVLAMASKVVPVEDSSADWKTNSPIGRVEIVTREGRTFERRGDNIPGSPEAPMTWDDLAQKFRDCAAAAAVPVAAPGIEKAVELVARLETLADVAEVIRTLV
jgi:2-methylcitrate dehydratase PrpD